MSDTDDELRLALAQQSPSRTARLIAELFSPAKLVIAITLFVAWRYAATPLSAVGWSFLTLALAVGAPSLILRDAVRRGRVEDRQVVRRSQRPALLAVALACAAAAFGLLTWADAPARLVALMSAMLTALLVMALVTTFARVKASFHAAVAAGATAVLIIERSLAAVPALFLVLLIGWARVREGRHTPSQVVMGAAIGGMIGGAVYYLLTSN